MRRAEELLPSVPDPLREEARLWTAYYWTYGGHFDEALRVAETVAAPEEHPGVEFIRMLYHDDRREDEALLECADRYEASMGPNPNSARYRSAALFRLGRLPEAARACRQFLRCNPDNVELLERFALAADAEQIAELPALLTSCSDPTESAVSLARSLDRFGDHRALGVVAKAISPREGRQFGLPMEDRTAPADDAQWLANGAKVAWVWGLHHESQGDDVTASELYLRAARSEKDPDERNWYLYRYLDLMQRLGRVVEAYRAVPEELAAETFAYLANGYEEEVSPRGARGAERR
jgi:tetratricopeptide (TPR) repeat protein